MRERGAVVSDRGFADLFREAESHHDFWEEQAIITFTEDLCLAMERVGVSRAELARRLGTSQAYVTKILRGNANFTLRTMARIALALGLEFRTHLAPRGSRTHWLDDLAFVEANEYEVTDGVPVDATAAREGYDENWTVAA